MGADPAVPVADDKDWTWVLERRCADCGFEAASVADLPSMIRDASARWQLVLERESVGVRPDPLTWSPLEYGCHIRDVFVLFDARARLMLAEDDPRFPNWDQDETAVAERYWEQSPGVVAEQLGRAGEQVAATFAGVQGEQWSRSGRRSNGSAFTVDSLGRYFIHDILHHLADVSG